MATISVSINILQVILEKVRSCTRDDKLPSKRHVFIACLFGWKEVCYSGLAEAAHFSPWYAVKIFKELTEASPADYIRRLKLSKSALRLMDKNVKIIDIAFDMGFSNVDVYHSGHFGESLDVTRSSMQITRSPAPVHTLWSKIQ